MENLFEERIVSENNPLGEEFSVKVNNKEEISEYHEKSYSVQKSGSEIVQPVLVESQNHTNVSQSAKTKSTDKTVKHVNGEDASKDLDTPISKKNILSTRFRERDPKLTLVDNHGDSDDENDPDWDPEFKRKLFANKSKLEPLDTPIKTSNILSEKLRPKDSIQYELSEVENNCNDDEDEDWDPEYKTKNKELENQSNTPIVDTPISKKNILETRLRERDPTLNLADETHEQLDDSNDPDWDPEYAAKQRLNRMSSAKLCKEDTPIKASNILSEQLRPRNPKMTFCQEEIECDSMDEDDVEWDPNFRNKANVLVKDKVEELDSEVVTAKSIDVEASSDVTVEEKDKVAPNEAVAEKSSDVVASSDVTVEEQGKDTIAKVEELGDQSTTNVEEHVEQIDTTVHNTTCAILEENTIKALEQINESSQYCTNYLKTNLGVSDSVLDTIDGESNYSALLSTSIDEQLIDQFEDTVPLNFNIFTNENICFVKDLIHAKVNHAKVVLQEQFKFLQKS